MARSTAPQREIDERHMRRALELAEKYRGRTAPNPIVGVVIVDKRGEVIAEGAHKGAGTKHAEIVALDKLGGRAPGATLYTTLEPCMHHGKTPPCVPAVKAAGVARVVVGTEDPVDGHGGGIESLRRGDISVSRVLVPECDASNRAFLTHARFQRPAFTLKAAVTLDGKIATVAGQSQWITGDRARNEVHHWRNVHDAIMVGIGTVLADDPWLSCRITGGRDPIRIVLDSQLRTPADARLLPRKKGPRTIIVTSLKAPEAKQRALEQQGAEVWRFKPRRNGHIPLYDLGIRLGEEPTIRSVFVEGGGQLHASLITQRYADEVILYLAPKVVGGPAPSWVGGKGVATLAAAPGFIIESVASVPPDLRLRLSPAPEREYPPRELPDDD